MVLLESAPATADPAVSQAAAAAGVVGGIIGGVTYEEPEKSVKR